MSSTIHITVERFQVTRLHVETGEPVTRLVMEGALLEEEDDLAPVEVEVEVDCDGHFYPGRYCGPPEDCEPDDYDFEIIDVRVDGHPSFRLTQDEERKVEEAFFDQEPDYPEPDYDYDCRY